MKSATTFILCFLVACIVSSCADGIDNYIADASMARDKESEKDTTKQDTDTIYIKPVVYPTFSDPLWKYTISTANYDNTMTVIAQLPDSLAASSSSNDKMAVLSGDTPRGILEYTPLSDTEGVWMGMVYGNGGEALRIGFYQTSTLYLYYTDTTFPFTADGHYGTLDNPLTLGLSVVTEQ